MILALVQMLLSETAAAPTTPTGIDLTGFAGIGGTTAVSFWLLQRLDKLIDAIATNRKRGNGGDPEHEAKTTSRANIERLVKNDELEQQILGNILEAQRELFNEMKSFRRENAKDHDRLEKLTTER